MISVDTECSMRMYNLCRSGKLKLTAIFVTLQAKEKQIKNTHVSDAWLKFKN